VACSLLVTTALATLAALVWYADERVNQQVDTELGLYAHQLQTSFRSELRTAHTALEAFRDKRLDELGGVTPHDPTSYVICDHILDDGKGACQSSGHPAGAGLQGDLRHLSGIRDDHPRRPRRVQREKWTIGNTNTPVINVKGFSIPRRHARRMLPLSDDPESPLPCPSDGRHVGTP
jgi:hypothetical protein